MKITLRATLALFFLLLLYPFTTLLHPGLAWRWDAEVATPALASIRTSLALTALAMVIVVIAGTPIALYIARTNPREKLFWQALLLLTILLPPLALGILLSIAFSPARIANTPLAFTLTQVYVSIGYYLLGAIAAFESVPPTLEQHAALLGHGPFSVFRRITLPLARIGLAVALSVAWVRAIGEFGAVAITSFYPAGMPVQLWVNLESFGLPAVLPLLVAFLAAALPLPWAIHLLAQRRHA